MTQPPDLDVSMSEDTRHARDLMWRMAAELSRRQGLIKGRLDYFRGRHPLVYASEEFAQYMGDRFNGFSDNWCLPVVQTTAERMDVLGIRLDDELRPDKDLNRVWRANDAERGSSEAFGVCLAASRAFGLVWGDPDDDDTPVITFERPDESIIAYDATSRQAIAGLKLWVDDDAGYEFATLYQPDRLWKFQRRGARSYLQNEPRPAVLPGGGWTPREVPGEPWPLPNPMGTVPLVEFRNQTLLDDSPLSDIDGVIAMQDAINLVWAYLLNGLDYASLPQRVAMGADIPRIPILDEQGQQVGTRPLDLNQLIKDRVLWIPGEDVKIGEWSAANLDVFGRVIEMGLEHIAAQTRTPPHYLIGKMVNMAAEALTAADAGQVSKTGERITYCTPTIRKMNSLVALAQGNEAKAKAARAGRVVWKDIHFRGLAQKVDALLKLKDIGFPFEWIAEEYGLEPQEVARVLKMREDQARMDPVAEIVRQMSQEPDEGDDDPR